MICCCSCLIPESANNSSLRSAIYLGFLYSVGFVLIDDILFSEDSEHADSLLAVLLHYTYTYSTYKSLRNQEQD